ncbi:MAG TPA: glutamine amidotransferase [Caulifigura sp.]|nr:glutamine amidotransferase [Caulifigura sp.]
MDVLVDPVWSWPVAGAVSLALLGVVLFTYPRRVAHLPPASRRTLITLRALSALVLAFAMFRPAVQFTEKDERGARLVVLMDASRSMTTPDGPKGATRRETLVAVLKEHEEALKKIGEQVDLQFVDFADEASPASAIPRTEGMGKYTAIGKALSDVFKQDSARRLVGVVLMSDGAQRAVGDLNVDPRAEARRFAEQRGAPIYTVPFGSSDLSGVGVDLAIEDVVVDPFPFERKTVPVRGFVRVSSAAGRSATVRLLLEDRSNSQVGQSGEFKPLTATVDARPVKEFTIPQGVTRVPFDLSFVAESSGDYKLRCEVVPLADEPKEVKVANNRFETLINVRKGGLKVKYFDVVRPEMKFISRLNDNAKVQLERIEIPSGQMQRPDSVTDDQFIQGRYDVYIIGDVPASVFGRPGSSLLDKLARNVNNGAGLLMIGGANSFGGGGYSQTAIADLIPVQMAVADAVGRGRPEQHLPPPVNMQPTREGLQHFVMQLAGPDADSETVWNRLPPLLGANRLIKKDAFVDVLATSPGEHDLLFARDTGRGRVMAFAGDSTYLWYLKGERAAHQRFWEQVLLWLAHQENQSDQAVWVSVDPRNISPGAKAPLRFGAQDPQKQPITGASFTVEVLTPKGEKRLVTPQQAGKEWFADFGGTNEPGDYWVNVTATKDGKLYGAASTRFIVDARDLELDNPAADLDLMNELASSTGATVIPPEGFGEFLKGLLSEGLAAELLKRTTVTLWDGWPLLLVFTLLMSTEWYLRKRRGLV